MPLIVKNSNKIYIAQSKPNRGHSPCMQLRHLYCTQHSGNSTPHSGSTIARPACIQASIIDSHPSHWEYNSVTNELIFYQLALPCALKAELLRDINKQMKQRVRFIVDYPVAVLIMFTLSARLKTYSLNDQVRLSSGHHQVVYFQLASELTQLMRIILRQQRSNNEITHILN